nr:hypothetical protein [Bacilli bacterium]
MEDKQALKNALQKYHEVCVQKSEIEDQLFKLLGREKSPDRVGTPDSCTQQLQKVANKLKMLPNCSHFADALNIALNQLYSMDQDPRPDGFDADLQLLALYQNILPLLQQPKTEIVKAALQFLYTQHQIFSDQIDYLYLQTLLDAIGTIANH